MKRYLLVVLIVGLWAITPFFSPGLPLTHDSQNHLARMANYYLAVKQGQLPPRSAPNLMNGLGYPVFNFNYPLANILAFPLIVVNFSVEQSYKLITVTAFLFSGMAMFLLVSKLFNRPAGLLAALFYMLNPYQLQLIFVRGVIGETLALALLPWVMYLWLGYEHNNSSKYFLALSFSLAAFWLSHNILVLFSLPLLLAFGFWRWRLDVSSWKRMSLPLILSLGLVSFFWIPALLEKKFTVLDRVHLASEYQNHFPSLGQLFSSAWGYGFSRPGPVDGLSFALGWAEWLVIALAGLRLLFQPKNSKYSWVLLGSFGIVLFILQPASIFLWKLFPLLQYVQFPWRLLFLAQFLVSLVAGWLMFRHRMGVAGKLILVGVLILSVRVMNQPNGWFSHPDDYWFSFPESTSILDENRAISLNKPEAYAQLSDSFRERRPLFNPAANTVKLDTFTGSKAEYSVNLYQNTQVMEPHAYFPGWRVFLSTGQEISAYPSPTGLVAYELPAGAYQVKSYFSQRTQSRLIGNSLSVIAMMGVLLRVAWIITRNYKPTKQTIKTQEGNDKQKRR